MSKSNWAKRALEEHAYKLEKIMVGEVRGAAFKRRLSPIEHGELFETVIGAIPAEQNGTEPEPEGERKLTPEEVNAQIIASQQVAKRCWYVAELVNPGESVQLDLWLDDDTGEVQPPAMVRGELLFDDESISSLELDNLADLVTSVTQFSGLGKEATAAAAHFPDE